MFLPFSRCHVNLPLFLSASGSMLANYFPVLFPEGVKTILGSLVLGLIYNKYDLITVVVGELCN